MRSAVHLVVWGTFLLVGVPAWPQSADRSEEYKKAFAWFDTLGFPDLKERPLIRVATGRRWLADDGCPLGRPHPVSVSTCDHRLGRDGATSFKHGAIDDGQHGYRCVL